MRQKHFLQKIMVSPYYAQNFTIPQILEKIKGSPAKCFGAVRQKDAKKSWYSFYPESFWYQHISQTQKESPTNIFGTVRRKFFQQKIMILSLLSSKIFNTRNLWKTKALHSEKFRYPETKKIYKVVVLLAYRQKIFNRKLWFIPLMLKNIR